MTDKLLLFGGWVSPEQPRSDGLFIFDIAAKSWSSISVTGDVPAPRFGAAMTFLGGYLHLFGGLLAHAHYSQELFALHIESWTWIIVQESSLTPWDPDVYGAYMFVMQGNLVLIFGRSTEAEVSNLWFWHVEEKQWILGSTSGAAPPGRAASACVYDVMERRLYISGGGRNGDGIPDMWTLTWSEQASSEKLFSMIDEQAQIL